MVVVEAPLQRSPVLERDAKAFFFRKNNKKFAIRRAVVFSNNVKNAIVKPAKKQVMRKAKTPVIRMLKPGMCEANCTNCPRGMQPIVEFAPAVSNKTHSERAKFLKIVKAINAINDVLNDPECMKLLDKAGLLRTKHCLTCRLILKKSRENPNTKFGACRAKWLEIKAELEEMGCVLCGCTDGMTVEHTNPSEKMRDAKGDPVQLSDCVRWTTLGGPAAMQAERDKPSVVPMCFNCHHMQPTYTAMKEKIDPDSLPDGKSSGTEEEVAAYKKKRLLIERRKKQAYVDGKKLAIGQCEDCTYRVVPWGSEWHPGHTGYPHAFQWAHRSELDKGDSVAKIVNNGLCFAKAKPKLDTDMARSRMLCQCCGKTETDKRKLAPGPSEEGN